MQKNTTGEALSEMLERQLLVWMAAIRLHHRRDKVCSKMTLHYDGYRFTPDEMYHRM